MTYFQVICDRRQYFSGFVKFLRFALASSFSPSGLHVRSTQQWTQFYHHASPAERKPLWRDCRSTISNRRKQNQEIYRRRACTVKSCCSVAPLSSALRNCVLNATSKRCHGRSEVKKIKLVPVLQTDASKKTDDWKVLLGIFTFI